MTSGHLPNFVQYQKLKLRVVLSRSTVAFSPPTDPAGKYLYDEAFKRDDLEVAFVWNRSSSKIREASVPRELILEDLEAVATR